MYNTAPLLRIDFQVIKRRERSDRRQRPNIAEKLQEVERGNAAKTAQGGRMRGVEVTNSSRSVSQVGNRLPGAISVGPSLPVNEILQALAFVS